MNWDHIISFAAIIVGAAALFSSHKFAKVIGGIALAFGGIGLVFTIYEGIAPAQDYSNNPTAVTSSEEAETSVSTISTTVDTTEVQPADDSDIGSSSAYDSGIIPATEDAVGQSYEYNPNPYPDLSTFGNSYYVDGSGDGNPIVYKTDCGFIYYREKDSTGSVLYDPVKIDYATGDMLSNAPSFPASDPEGAADVYLDFYGIDDFSEVKVNILDKEKQTYQWLQLGAISDGVDHIILMGGDYILTASLIDDNATWWAAVLSVNASGTYSVNMYKQ